MLITSIQKQKNNDKKFNILVENEYSFSVEIEDLAEYGIHEGMEVDEDELKDIIGKCQYKKALNAAYKFLSVRPRSCKETLKKLTSLHFDGSVIEKVINRLKELNYLDDAGFARSWIEERKNLKPTGRRCIISELITKGIEPQVIEDCLEDLKFDDLDTAVEIARKKLSQMKYKLESPGDYQKVYRYLLYRGIDYETAQKAISKCIETREEFEY